MKAKKKIIEVIKVKIQKRKILKQISKKLLH